MKAFRRLSTIGAAVAMLAAMTPASAFVTEPFALDSNLGPGTPGVTQAGDISLVAHIGGWSGSDIEFASREVVKLSGGATGDPVCETDANGDCLLDADGNEIYQTEIRDFAVAGALSQNARIVDITDPEDPVVVGQTPCAINQNDIQIQGDILLVAADGSGTCKRPDGSNQAFQGTAVLDFSDPRNPTYLSRVTYGRGSHNHTFHPTEPYVYLSDSDLASAGLGNIPVWDLSDPADPKLVTELKHLVHSPHDITFNADGSRAYAAAVSATYIINTEDPENPTIVSTIPNEGISISHQSDPTPDGKFLLVGDELGGGSAPTVSPGGPVHVYDISVEERPVKIGAFGNDCQFTACDDGQQVHVSTAHVFRINPDGYTMAIAWYQDGIHVVDFSDVYGANALGTGAATGVAPRVIASMKTAGANSWAAKMWQERHPGYVFSNDISRGLDVFYVPELDNGFIGTGTIRAGHPATTQVGGVTEHTFATVGGCSDRPATQGVDGYVFRDIPADLADGDDQIFLTATHGAAPDLTVWSYDSGCSLISTTPVTSGGFVPEGARHLVVNGFTGAQVRFSAYIR